MLRTTNAAGRIRDESLMNLGGRATNKFTDIQMTIFHSNSYFENIFDNQSYRSVLRYSTLPTLILTDT
jgi:hypothetical protein